MATFSPGIETDTNKTALMLLFGYNIIDNIIETPCGDIVDYDVLWKWMIRNGVSLHHNYQNNMSVYLERFGFIRTLSTQRRVIVQDIVGREITQKRALLAADQVRSKRLNVPCVLIISEKHVYVANTHFAL